MKITIGCDPELFVTKDGQYRAAWGLIPGTKEKPFPVQNGAVQVDGCALEYNIDPVDNVEDFIKFNLSVQEQMKAMVPGYDFAIVPSCRFNGNHFRSLPEEAKELGCTPDFNAYTLEENDKPDNDTTMRAAGGHVHIGFVDPATNPDFLGQDHMIRCATLVKQLDSYLGLPSIIWDSDKNRRKMYGMAGAFRPKPYGVEYRTLSNAWIKDPRLMKIVFNQTTKAVTDLIGGIRPSALVGEDYVRTLINSSNSGCRDIIHGYIKGGPALLKELDVVMKEMNDVAKG